MLRKFKNYYWNSDCYILIEIDRIRLIVVNRSLILLNKKIFQIIDKNFRQKTKHLIIKQFAKSNLTNILLHYRVGFPMPPYNEKLWHFQCQNFSSGKNDLNDGDNESSLTK
ncbi:hypothetical protein BpHYR1_030710 [Brachionus plicatilis]|uniref:Uncharacterized protein n=1 Tax=Brachionus plicatilis TaxID=10195 RepID=A0A3M7PI81_BRAPC|nr:hypothetical protein BpHYR1_030710 [Brachionus plicatilis]